MRAVVLLLAVWPLLTNAAEPPQREVQVATRRLRKGSAVDCSDLQMKRRDARRVPKDVLASACSIAPDSVALRNIGAGDILRSLDIGRAPDVAAGERVRLDVSTNGISVSTTAVALTDARIGDMLDVRLQRPTRTLKTRVSAPGVVQLADGNL